MEYKKLNDEPIELSFSMNPGYPSDIPKGVDVELNSDPVLGFVFNDQTYLLSDFVRTHDNPWISDIYPEYIHAFEAGNTVNPLYIELISDGAVNVYEAIKGS